MRFKLALVQRDTGLPLPMGQVGIDATTPLDLFAAVMDEREDLPAGHGLTLYVWAMGEAWDEDAGDYVPVGMEWMGTSPLLPHLLPDCPDELEQAIVAAWPALAELPCVHPAPAEEDWEDIPY